MDLETTEESTEELTAVEPEPEPEPEPEHWWSSYVPRNFVVCGPATFYAFIWKSTVFLFFGEYHEHYGNDWDLTAEEEEVQCNPVYGKNGIVHFLVNLFSTLERRGIYTDMYLEATRGNPEKYALERKPAFRFQGVIEKEDRAGSAVNLIYIIRHSIYQNLIKPRIQTASRKGNLEKVEKILKAMNVRYHLADGRYLYMSSSLERELNEKLKGEFWPNKELSGVLESANPYGRIWQFSARLARVTEKMRTTWEEMKALKAEEFPEELGTDERLREPMTIEALDALKKKYVSKKFFPALQNLGIELIIQIAYLDFCLVRGAQLLETFLEPRADTDVEFDDHFSTFEIWIRGSAYMFVTDTLGAEGLARYEELAKRSKIYAIVKALFAAFKGECGWKKGKIPGGPKTHHRIAKQIAACDPFVGVKIKKSTMCAFESARTAAVLCLPSVDWPARLTQTMDNVKSVLDSDDLLEIEEAVDNALKSYSRFFQMLNAMEDVLVKVGTPFMDAYLLGRMFANLNGPHNGPNRRSKVCVVYAGASHVATYNSFMSTALNAEEIGSSYYSGRHERKEEDLRHAVKNFELTCIKADGDYGNRNFEFVRERNAASGRFWNFYKKESAYDVDKDRPKWMDEEIEKYFGKHIIDGEYPRRLLVSFSNENYKKLVNEIETGVRYDFGIGAKARPEIVRPPRNNLEKNSWFFSPIQCANCDRVGEEFRCENCFLVGYCSKKCLLDFSASKKCHICKDDHL